MRETKIRCDHCRKELDPLIDWTDDGIAFGSYVRPMDLCEDCVEQLAALLNEFCAGGSAKEEGATKRKCCDCVHDNVCSMWAVVSGIPFVNSETCEHFKNDIKTTKESDK